MMEYRIKSKRSQAFMDKYKGAQVLPGMINILLQGAAKVYKPNGKLLCVYLPGALSDLSETAWPDFSSIRLVTRNRGYAAGGDRVATHGTGSRSTAPVVTSSILGSIDMDRARSKEVVCRLTSFNAQEVEKWDRLQPTFRAISDLFREHVPDRYAAQVARAANTEGDWLIKGTPFTTITVNNTYPTGIHTDKGDLDEGFSTLACFRRGDFTGGWLTFVQYGVAADLQDGDLLLMDAHDWHGNTPILCRCGESLRKYGHNCSYVEDTGVSPERVSIVSYYRTQIEQCGTAAEEEAKRLAIREESNLRAIGLEYGEV